MKRITFVLKLFPLTLFAFTVSPPPSQSAILTSIPMHIGMVHVNFGYDTATSPPRLRVQIDPVPVDLIPLSVSNPEDHFESTAPWFLLLDPSGGGQAFSRRFGFVLTGDSAPIPAGYGICIRRLAASPGLETYRYRQSTPPVFEPMFGTGLSTNLFLWNLKMFHPVYVAPPFGGPHSATYEAWLINDAGQTVTPSEQFTLTWSLSEALHFDSVTLADGTAEFRFVSLTNWIHVLERTSNFADWTHVASITNPTVGPLILRDPSPSPSSAFYRLRCQKP